MAKIPIKLLPLVGIIILLAVIGFFLVESEKEYVEDPSHEETVPAADVSARKFKVTQPDSDKGTTYVLEADEGGYLNGVGWCKKFRMKLNTKDGLDLELEGNKVEINREKNEIIFSGEIEGKTSDCYLIYTENLIFQEKEGSLKSDEIVTIVGPFFRMTGKGLFVDLKKETIDILKDINSTFDKESLNI